VRDGPCNHRLVCNQSLFEGVYMFRRILVAVLLLVTVTVSGCRCVAQGVNGLGKDFQAWTQPYVDEQQAKHQAYAQEH
jgi:predicted small secreted protein